MQITSSTKIELRSISYNARLSEETNAFAADIYIDGKKAGYAHNQGHGGPTMIDPQDLDSALSAYAKTLPQKQSSIKDEQHPTGFWHYQPSAETIIDDLLTDELTRRDMKRTMVRNVLVVHTKDGKLYQHSIKGRKAAEILNSPKHAEQLRALGPVLNTMPEAEALALYRKHG